MYSPALYVSEAIKTSFLWHMKCSYVPFRSSLSQNLLNRFWAPQLGYVKLEKKEIFLLLFHLSFPLFLPLNKCQPNTL